MGQWAAGKGLVSPMARVIVAMADVGLEYVAAQPQVLGIGGEGEKLVGAIAVAVSTAIPDATDRSSLGPKDRFAERLARPVGDRRPHNDLSLTTGPTQEHAERC